MKNSDQLNIYIDKINNMKDPQEVIDFLDFIVKENPNDSILGNIIRSIIHKIKWYTLLAIHTTTTRTS